MHCLAEESAKTIEWNYIGFVGIKALKLDT